ncbi:MAG: hypothetical protein U0R80_10490 [Nocardioidaceae bacterium]
MRSRPRAVKRVADLVEAVLEEVAVGVQRHGGGGVSEHLLDDLDVGPRGDGQAGGGVPQLVRVQVGNADRRRGRPEADPEGAHPQRLSGADAGEDEVLLPLAREVAGQLGGQEPGDRHLAALMGLGSAPHQALAGDRCHRLRDDGPVAAEVEPADLERGHLTEADACVGEEQDDEPVHLVGAGVVGRVLARIRGVTALGGQLVDLVVGEVEVLAPADAWQVDPRGDVASQPPVTHRQIEDQAEYAVDLLDAGGGELLPQLDDPRLDVTVRHVGQAHPAPLRDHVTAQYPVVARVGRRLQMSLRGEPLLSPVSDRHLGQRRVDVPSGHLGVLDGGEEPLRVDLARERLVALAACRRSVVSAPGHLAVADTLLDAGHGSSCLPGGRLVRLRRRVVDGWTVR